MLACAPIQQQRIVRVNLLGIADVSGGSICFFVLCGAHGGADNSDCSGDSDGFLVADSILGSALGSMLFSLTSTTERIHTTGTGMTPSFCIHGIRKKIVQRVSISKSNFQTQKPDSNVQWHAIIFLLSLLSILLPFNIAFPFPLPHI